VTSPPFLDVVNYAADNWLRCWFCGIDTASVQMSMHKKVADWQTAMTDVFRELARVLKRGGYVAFEVGEVRNGRIKLEEAVLPCGVAAGLEPQMIVINSQAFTKTANCWGVKNNAKGTNTNRIVVFRNPEQTTGGPWMARQAERDRQLAGTPSPHPSAMPQIHYLVPIFVSGRAVATPNPNLPGSFPVTSLYRC
jgi:hypothetical protein